MSIYRPLGDAVCNPAWNSATCNGYTMGWNAAQDTAHSQGLFDQAFAPVLELLTLPEAQTLLPAILSVLVVAFGARLIIQLVKKG